MHKTVNYQFQTYNGEFQSERGRDDIKVFGGPSFY